MPRFYLCRLHRDVWLRVFGPADLSACCKRAYAVYPDLIQAALAGGPVTLKVEGPCKQIPPDHEPSFAEPAPTPQP
jgi:hypothetical protein